MIVQRNYVGLWSSSMYNLRKYGMICSPIGKGSDTAHAKIATLGFSLIDVVQLQYRYSTVLYSPFRPSVPPLKCGVLRRQN